jgi:hypothetical protein
MRHSISTAKYVFAHGKEPKGHGTWAFTVDRSVEYHDGRREERSTYFAPREMSYTEAKRWIRHNVAGQRDIVTISVAS